jgi:hypothetical protein
MAVYKKSVEELKNFLLKGSYYEVCNNTEVKHSEKKCYSCDGGCRIKKYWY